MPAFGVVRMEDAEEVASTRVGTAGGMDIEAPRMETRECAVKRRGVVRR